MADKEKGALEKLVSKAFEVVEKVCSPVTQYAPKVCKDAYQSFKDITLEYACRSLDTVAATIDNYVMTPTLNFATKHPVAFSLGCGVAAFGLYTGWAVGAFQPALYGF